MDYGTIRLAAFGLTSLFALAGAGQAQPSREIGWGVIQGSVLPPKGQPVLPAPITVTLTSRQMDLVVAKTATMGSFEFVGLFDGTYTIKIESPGYAFAERTVSLSRSVRGEVITIALALGDPLSGQKELPPRNADQTVSAKWLSVPGKAIREMEKAEKASRKGNPEKAVKHLKKALLIHPQLPQALNNLAVQYMKLGQNEKALQALSKALEIHPEDAFASLNLGLIHIGSGEYEKALGRLARADQLEPGRYKTLAVLAATYFQVGKYGLALDHYRKILAIRPDGHDVLLSIGDCHTRMNQLEEAIEALKDFIAKSPQDRRLPGVQAQIERLRALLSK
ncbi:MAG: tetratricopeptide repeat protein [Acidobacteriota bacterium]